MFTTLYTILIYVHVYLAQLYQTNCNFSFLLSLKNKLKRNKKHNSFQMIVFIQEFIFFILKRNDRILE